jgi:hypothetical protein
MYLLGFDSEQNYHYAYWIAGESVVMISALD